MSSGTLTLDCKVLKYSADCVEWCPIIGFQNIFACGTYQLEDEGSENSDKCSMQRTRLGCIYLFKVNNQGSLTLIQTYDTPGVLDMKWHPYTNFSDLPVLAVANAEGRVLILELKSQEDSIKLTLIESFKCSENEGILCLSLDWAVINNTIFQLVVSDSSGAITLLKMGKCNLETVHKWNIHRHEAWIASFDSQDPNVVYSGGDDSVLAVYDVRRQFQVIAIKEEHNSGVTSLSCEKNHNILASGSYDEKLRLWDKRNWRIPTDQINLGGGVWKIKWKPCLSGKLQSHLIAACMHAGFKLVDCTSSWNGGKMFESLTYAKNDSLAYGCDWNYAGDHSELSVKGIHNADIKGLLASCSFYDCKLSLWLLYQNVLNSNI